CSSDLLSDPMSLSEAKAVWEEPEYQALKTDVAPGQIISNAALTDIAKQIPRSINQLRRIPQMRRRSAVELNAWAHIIRTAADSDPRTWLGRLTRLIEDIDEVSRAQEHRIDIDLVTEPLGELIHTAATTAQESYQVKGVGLQATDVSPAATVTVDRQRFGQVMSNLLANALRHTPAGGHVTISATQQGAGTILIEVADTGEGMT